MKLGLIGLGHMGLNMASRLLEARHELIAYDRTPAKAEALRRNGATVAASISDACASDAVITMVSDDRAIEQVVFGTDGILESLPAGKIHISSSTISVGMAARIAAAHASAGQRFVAAAVLGRPEAAKAGSLFVLAAGDRATIDAVAPVLDVIGQRTFVVSDRPELALLVKLNCNFLISSVIESLGEAMALVQKAGVDPRRFLDIITATLFDAPAYKTYGELIADRRFEPAEFGAALGEKDLRLTLAAAEELRVPMPVASLIRDRFLRLLARGGERLDWSALGGLAAQDAGITER
jgi:3-hydroxyisobutyrate dehydrogenase-like beta-hydroxyacid dehydrogenase